MKKKFRLVLENHHKLSSSVIWRGGWLSFSLGALAFLAIATLLAVVLIVATPLRTLLPGYMKEGQRDLSMQAWLRVDSLRHEHDVNQAYMENLFTVLNTDRTPADSLEVAKRGNVAVTDTLQEASPEERRFMSLMEQREKYNISILAPAAAEGVGFHNVAPGVLFSDASRTSEDAELIIPKGVPVSVIADGTVVALNYEPKIGAYAVLVQHSKGFLSKYEGLARPTVGLGEHVEAGTALGFPNRGRLGLKLWRNGDKLIPADYL